MIFWGSITYSYKGPCYIYAKETAALRQASLDKLKLLNDAREIDEHSEWDIEQANIDAQYKSNRTQRRGVRPLCVELVHVTLDWTQHGIICPISLNFYICFYQHKLSCI